MSAVTTERYGPHPYVKKTFDGRIGANQKIYRRALIAIVGGYWVNVTATTGLEGKYAIAMETVDNTGGAAGALPIKVEFLQSKTFWLAKNDTVNPIVPAN